MPLSKRYDHNGLWDVNPHMDFWDPRGPQKTLIVAPTVNIIYTSSYSFWGPLDPANSGSVSFFVNPYEG